MRTAERELALAASREALQIREEFLSIAAHELKTPVAALRLHAQLALRRLDGVGEVDLAMIRAALNRIDIQSHKLAGLTDQLLDAARLERGALSLVRRWIDLRDVVNEVRAAPPHRDRIVGSMPSVPQLVWVDQVRLEQVLTNLVDNAAKFSPDNERIEITLEAVGDTATRLSVEDHGLGIPLAHRARIFERFYQAHAESHRSGLGLGLYISKQIVDMHDGLMRVEFPSRGGTRFVVDLPLQRAIVAAPSTSGSAQ
jgi:signal transduction histidine kinase